MTASMSRSTAVQRVVFVTGMSGSGKATALRALEDAGWFCIDNLPVPLVPRIIELLGAGSKAAPLAIAIDAREKSFLGDAPQILDEARARGAHVELLFLDASDELLIRRFSETRRRHPVAPDGTVPEGIAAERAVLQALRARADWVVDTTHTTVHELKRMVQERYGEEAGREPTVTITSFGYRYGLPAQSDLVLDVRFLPNPYFVERLRELPGTAAPVSEWVLSHPVAREFVSRVQDLLTFLLPRYRDEGKAYLTVAVGCTGGRHRSTALAEALGAGLAQAGVRVRVRHRDVDRE